MGQAGPCGCINTRPTRNSNIPHSPTIRRKYTQKTDFYSQRKKDELNSPTGLHSIQNAENFPDVNFRFKKANKGAINDTRGSSP
jgi:hypothetical protein